MKKKLKSLKDTETVAKEFAKTLKVGDIVLLNGNLGAGKTTFTQFVFHALGVDGVVNSPTFAILKTYKGKFNLYHFDTYRITTEEAIEAGFDEIFDKRDGVIFVEWSENILPIIPKQTININLTLNEDGTREIEIEK